MQQVNHVAEVRMNLWAAEQKMLQPKKKKKQGKGSTDASGDTPVKGKSFTVTGTLRRFTRVVARNRIRRAGGRWNDNVLRSTDYLVIADRAGRHSSKVRLARKYGTTTISEEQFYSLIGA